MDRDLSTAFHASTRGRFDRKWLCRSSADPPLLDKAVQHVLRNEHKKKSVEEGTHEISNGKTYRVIKGDHLGGNVNFKYRGYNSDLKEMM